MASGSVSLSIAAGTLAQISFIAKIKRSQRLMATFVDGAPIILRRAAAMTDVFAAWICLALVASKRFRSLASYANEKETGGKSISFVNPTVHIKAAHAAPLNKADTRRAPRSPRTRLRIIEAMAARSAAFTRERPKGE